METRPAPISGRSVFNLDPPAMNFQNASRVAEAQARAFTFGREKGLEYFRHVFLGNPRTFIFDEDLHLRFSAVYMIPGGHMDASLLRGGLYGIEQQIDEGLSQLFTVPRDIGNARSIRDHP